MRQLLHLLWLGILICACNQENSMMQAFEKLGDKTNYDKAKRRFDQAWKHADLKIASSRIL